MSPREEMKEQKSISNKNTERERKNQQANQLRKQEFLWLPCSKKALKLEDDIKSCIFTSTLNPKQSKVERSKEFATYVAGEDGLEAVEEGVGDDMDIEVKRISNMEDDIAEVGEKPLGKRKEMDKVRHKRPFKKSESDKEVPLTFDLKLAKRAIKSFAKHMAGKIQRKKSNRREMNKVRCQRGFKKSEASAKEVSKSARSAMKLLAKNINKVHRKKDKEVKMIPNMEDDLAEVEEKSETLKIRKETRKKQHQKGLKKSEPSSITTKKVSSVFDSKSARRAIKLFANHIGESQSKIANMTVEKRIQSLKNGKEMDKLRWQKTLKKSEPAKHENKNQRKFGKKLNAVVEEQDGGADMDKTPTRFWLRKYYRRLG